MVSVIIPAYNRAKTIERSINSVLHQTYGDIEVIVVDDCSDDDLKTVLSSIRDERIRYYRLDTRSGACAARNRGIQEARGEYIAFQDSDDEWVENKLEIQLDALDRNHADVCFCMLRRHYIGENAKVVLWPENIQRGNRFMDPVQLRRKSHISTQTILARRNVFEDIQFDVMVVKSQDYDWAIRASEKYSVYMVSEPLVEQYLQQDSISMGGYNKFIDSRTYFLQKYQALCEEDPEFKYQLLQQLAHYKSLSGTNASKEYYELYRIKRKPHDLLCAVLSRLHLMKLVLR